ncbi:MAG: bile acid:sodium symporter, partial [Planctomycetota bacterium]
MAPIVERIRRHFLWLLLGAYALAALLPGPGAEIARFDLGVRLGVGARITAPLMMVAVLLFLAAMAVEVRELRVLLQRPLLWLTAVACVWLGPVAAVGVAGWVLPAVASESAAGMLLGMTLVAAMPVANSSVAWTQQSGGSLPWSLGLVVLSILLTPWVTPRLLHLSGVALLSDEPELIEQATLAFSGAPFIVWVLLPTAAGLTTRRLLGPASTDELTSGRLLLSTAILLVLNYAAGSLALREQPTLGELAGAL